MKLCGVGWEASQVTGRGACRSCGWMCPLYHCVSVKIFPLVAALLFCKARWIAFMHEMNYTNKYLEWSDLWTVWSDPSWNHIPTAYSVLHQKLSMHFDCKITLLQYFDLKFCIFLPLTVTPLWATNKMLLLKPKDRVWDVSGCQTEGTQCVGPPLMFLNGPGPVSLPHGDHIWFKCCQSCSQIEIIKAEWTLGYFLSVFLPTFKPRTGMRLVLSWCGMQLNPILSPVWQRDKWISAQFTNS